MKIITRDQIGTKNKCHIQSLVKSQWKKHQGNYHIDVGDIMSQAGANDRGG